MTFNFSKKHVGHYIWYFKIVCILMKLDLWGSKMNLKWKTIMKVEEYLYTGLKHNFSTFLLWLLMFSEKHVGHYIWYFKIVCIFLKFELWGSRMTLKWITIINVEEYLKAGIKFKDFLNLKNKNDTVACGSVRTA